MYRLVVWRVVRKSVSGVEGKGGDRCREWVPPVDTVLLCARACAVYLEGFNGKLAVFARTSAFL